ncbi:MAG: hypothetical protein KDA28_10590 [Phycisphaerales bacterium]|nr:hypothetical protein [Phycisphaerales bacterium]
MISGLALGGVTLLVGPDRVAAGLYQLREKAQHVVDAAVDDPIALRRQLETLAAEYPERISKVQAELGQVTHELNELGVHADKATRVVAATTSDLTELQALIAEAEAADTGVRQVAIRFDGARFDVPGAYEEARRINEVRLIFQDRQAMTAQQIALLSEQRARLTEIHEKLTTEYATFHGQLWQLDRQIDAIKRNERLIEMVKQQQETLNTYDKFGNVGNLQQLERKLNAIQDQQRAHLEALANTRDRLVNDYENRAELERFQESVGGHDDPFKDLGPTKDDAMPAKDSKTIVLGPVVIGR